MGRQIVKQPDELYSVWSSIVGGFIYEDCTKQDLIDFFVKEEKIKIEDMVNDQIEKLTDFLCHIKIV